MFADYEYYKNDFYGIKIKSEDEYKYLAQKASRYIEKYTNKVNDDTKSCECAISEVLQTSNSNIISESIPNAYSVSYKDTTTTLNDAISELLELYLGSDIYSLVGAVKVIG